MFKVSSGWVTQQRARHTVASTATTTQFGAGYGDHFDACLAQPGIGIIVTIICYNNAWLERQ